MVQLTSLLVPLFAVASLASSSPKCLTDDEAWSFSRRWLDIWSTGKLTKESQLYKLVTKNVLNLDGTYGAATIGIDALYASATYVDPLVTDVVQSPEFVFHSCDSIAARWSYNAVSTGNGSTVPAGTKIFLEGIELLTVDLKSRLIYNSTSSADWVLLATQLGQTVNL
ncbi:hypothetical protein BT63DRAFT_21041 [Microthyrium microscopicum]|uniref:NTF2-like domain-containing protein n=1 Tax=Microthyrium microscopicum TaxID=703497 RepID=A0A6A6URA8_9PEZI|nr:hypothetical protein BT63DRAFT_21041 [Microthyrium microscopicum]